MSLILGVDGGNTKTVALLAREDGEIVGTGRAGCGDMYNVGEDRALEAIEGAVRAAAHAAGVEAALIESGGFSLAGADWPEDYAFLQESVLARGLARSAVVVNDALGALRAGSDDGTGVSVVCGTGLAVGGRASNGCFWHGSFWLESHGGHTLGRAVVRTVLRAELGIEPRTALTERVLQYFSCERVEEVLHLLTARGEHQVDQGSLAYVLLDTAEAGDAIACSLVERHGEDIGAYACVAARRVGLEGQAFPLVLAGGVLRHPSPLLADAITARVQRASPDAWPQPSRFEPAVGALFLGFERAGLEVDAARRANIERTLPPATLFATLP